MDLLGFFLGCAAGYIIMASVADDDDDDDDSAGPSLCAANQFLARWGGVNWQALSDQARALPREQKWWWASPSS